MSKTYISVLTKSLHDPKMIVLLILGCYIKMSTPFISNWKNRIFATNENIPYSSIILNQAKANNDPIGGAYEYKGPMSGGIPVEISSMFNLKQGRKIKKGDGNLKGKRKASSSSPSSSSSSKTSSSNDDDRDFGLDELERSVMSKYGSKTVKESVLSPLDDDDKLLQQQRMSTRARFEGFGAKKPSPAREAFQTTSPADNKKTRNNDEDMSEDELSEALFKGSRTMSQYISKQPKSSTNTKSSKNDNSGVNKKNGDVRHWDFSNVIPASSIISSDEDFSDSDDDADGYLAAPPKRVQQVINQKDNRNMMKTTEKKNIAVKTSTTQKPNMKMKPFFKDDVINEEEDDDDDDDDNGTNLYNDEDDEEDEDEDIYEQESFPTTQKYNKNIVTTKNQNNVMKSIDSVDDFFDNDDDYDYDHDTSDTIETNDNRNNKQKSIPSNIKTSTNTNTASSTAIPMNTMYRLRAPIIPKEPELTEKQKTQLLLKQQQEIDKIEKIKQQRLLQKNEFFPFQFEYNNSNYINYQDNKLFSANAVQSDKMFEDLGISNPIILDNLYKKLNIAIPTKIQEMALPVIMAGNDVSMTVKYVYI